MAAQEGLSCIKFVSSNYTVIPQTAYTYSHINISMPFPYYLISFFFPCKNNNNLVDCLFSSTNSTGIRVITLIYRGS
jgi:hypothetical protein